MDTTTSPDHADHESEAQLNADSDDGSPVQDPGYGIPLIHSFLLSEYSYSNWLQEDVHRRTQLADNCWLDYWLIYENMVYDHPSSRLLVVTDWVELFSIRDTHNLCFARLTTSSDGVDKREREREKEWLRWRGNITSLRTIQWYRVGIHDKQ